MTYQNCPAAGRVQVLTVAGGGHAWPGGVQFALPRVIGLASRQIDVSSAIVDFFLSLPPR
jgi:polyhydroxybutyrate depolymerase